MATVVGSEPRPSRLRNVERILNHKSSMSPYVVTDMYVVCAGRLAPNSTPDKESSAALTFVIACLRLNSKSSPGLQSHDSCIRDACVLGRGPLASRQPSFIRGTFIVMINIQISTYDYVQTIIFVTLCGGRYYQSEGVVAFQLLS